MTLALLTTSLPAPAPPATIDPHRPATVSIVSTAARPPCRIPAALAERVADRKPAQVLLVTAVRTRARVQGCTRIDGGYVRTLGPYRARVGRNGVAARGAKREGDGRTPSGLFALGKGFGTDPDPDDDSAFGWFTPGPADVWVDDPESAVYHTHQVGPARGRWRSAEKLQVKPYQLAQVILYNRARTPGRGSAIFLHVRTGRATAGCVSLAKRHLQAVMKWEVDDAMVGITGERR